MLAINKRHISGKNDELISVNSSGFRLHREVISPFEKLQAAASGQGFDLAIVSAYRSFDRQLVIWNEKVLGVRDVVNDQGEIIDMMRLTPWQQVQAILRWSALPGASRHHWGTDLDVYDRSAVDSDYCPLLSLKEVEDSGPFGELHCWLDQCIERATSYDFFRPYTQVTGGVAPERWHLSYAPLSAKFHSMLAIEHLVELIVTEPLLLKDVVLEHIEEIYRRYIDIPVSVYPSKYRKYFL